MRADQGLSEAESHRLNARLVLILANHVGDLRVLQEAIAHVRSSLASESFRRRSWKCLQTLKAH